MTSLRYNFIDALLTPVLRCDNGLQKRYAFLVAEPRILDAAERSRLARMRNNPQLVRRFCTRAAMSESAVKDAVKRISAKAEAGR